MSHTPAAEPPHGPEAAEVRAEAANEATASGNFTAEQVKAMNEHIQKELERLGIKKAMDTPPPATDHAKPAESHAAPHATEAKSHATGGHAESHAPNKESAKPGGKSGKISKALKGAAAQAKDEVKSTFSWETNKRELAPFKFALWTAPKWMLQKTWNAGINVANTIPKAPGIIRRGMARWYNGALGRGKDGKPLEKAKGLGRLVQMGRQAALAATLAGFIAGVPVLSVPALAASAIGNQTDKAVAWINKGKFSTGKKASGGGGEG